MSMRKQFIETVEAIIKEDERAVLLLGDIGVFGFRKIFETHKERVFNIGILEQSTISMASGMAMTGLIPIVHTIAPFLVERGLEQLKIDFGYQKLGGNFVSVGASYDYAALGCTHHCPGDVGILKNIPTMEIIIPGTAKEFDLLFRQSYANGNPTYYRLSEKENSQSFDVKFGKAQIVKKGNIATIIAVGPTLQTVMDACAGIDVTILYYSTVIPFDAKILEENCPSEKVLLCEPYYQGALAYEILNSFGAGKSIKLDFVGVPHEFLTNYGKAEQQDEFIGLTSSNIKNKINKLIYE